jgi:FtsH-binding integral membrane protein
VVSQYDSAIVSEAVRVTGIVTACMMFLGMMFPKFFIRIAGVLSTALFLVIIVECVEIFLLNMPQEA